MSEHAKTETDPLNDHQRPEGQETEANPTEAHSAGGAAQAGSNPPPTRDEEMERLRQTAAEADKRVLQAQAEAENFRKRMRRDFEDQLKYASTDLILDLLQVRDNLCRAIDAASAGDQATGAGDQGKGLSEGVEMVVKQMDDVLGKYGVEEIPSQGEVFDPNFHEAISQIPSEDVESGKIAHVAVCGFKLHDRVIRPSQVVVSTGPAT